MSQNKNSLFRSTLKYARYLSTFSILKLRFNTNINRVQRTKKKEKISLELEKKKRALEIILVDIYDSTRESYLSNYIKKFLSFIIRLFQFFCALLYHSRLKTKEKIVLLMSVIKFKKRIIKVEIFSPEEKEFRDVKRTPRRLLLPRRIIILFKGITRICWREGGPYPRSVLRVEMCTRVVFFSYLFVFYSNICKCGR